MFSDARFKMLEGHILSLREQLADLRRELEEKNSITVYENYGTYFPLSGVKSKKITIGEALSMLNSHLGVRFCFRPERPPSVFVEKDPITTFTVASDNSTGKRKRK